MKKFLVSLILLFTFTTVNANEPELNLNKKEVNLGEEVTISLDSYSDDIKLNYDKNVFSAIDIDNFKNNKHITSEGNTFYLNKESNLKIKLKVKKDAPSGKTAIKVSYGNKNISKYIKIDGKAIKEKSNLWILYGILTIALIGAIIYYYNQNKNKIGKQQIIYIIVASIVAIILLIMTFTSLNNKDNKVDKDNLIYKIKVKENEEKIKDNELDDNTDTTISKEKYSKQSTSNKKENQIIEDIVYDVKLNSYSTSTKITKKGDDIVITFDIDIKPYADIKAVEINGKIYSVQRVGDKYQTTIKASNIYGDGNYTITKVVLSNGKTVNVENKHITVYVLKEEPKIENIEVNSKEVIPVLNFDVKDPDNSFVSGSVVMTKTTNPIFRTTSLFKKLTNNISKENELLNSENVKVGHNSFEIKDLKEGMGYDLKITLNYDLDEDKTDSTYSDTKEEEKTETFEREYNFELKNAEITSPVSKNQELKLSFENGAFSYTDIEKITINGKEYEVTKDEETGVYTVNAAIDKCSEKGKCSLHISSVKVTTESKESKEIPYDYDIDYIYLKDQPTINSFNATYDQKNITATFNITDTDTTITNGKIILKQNDEEYSISLTKEELAKTSVTKNLNLKTAGDYTVTLVVNYDLGDGKTLEKTKDSENTIHQNITASIESVKIPEKKVNRNDNIDLYYTIKSNTNEEVQSITINNTSYSTTKQSDGTYKVTVQVPTEGEGLTRIFKATEIKYQKETITLNKAEDTVVDIYKLIPKISEFTLTSAGGQISGTFKFTDEENAIVGAKYTIGSTTRTLTEEELENNKFTDSDVKSAGNYDVTLTLIYDLGDGNKLEDVTSKQQVKVEVNATITESSINPKFVKKGEEVTITYTIKDNTPSTLSKIIINNKEVTDINSLGEDKYEVKIKIAENESAGEKEFKTTKLIYEDEEEFELENTVKATVLKEEPIIGEFTATYDEEQDKINGSISITDPESTITGGKLTITGPGLDKPKEISITKEELLKASFTKDLELPKMGEYKVSLEITYNLGEKDITTDPMETTINKALEITSVDVEAPQSVIKNGKIELIYTIKDNTDEKVTKIKINNEEKEVTYDKETDTYKVEYTDTSTSGNIKYKTTEITYETSGTREVTVDNKNVYVLKDKPVINDEPTYTDKTATVSIADNDTAKTSAKIKFTKVGTEEETKSIDISEDGIADIHELSNGTYNVTIEIEYDLDGADSSLPETIGKVTKEYKNVSIITNYDSVNVSSLSLNSFVNPDKVILDFTVTNDTTATITEVKIGDKWYIVDQKDSSNNYTVTIDNSKERKELQITELKFSTDVTKMVTNDQKILINKTIPTAQVTVSEDETNKVTANITITDDDNTITENTKYAVLRQSDDPKTEIERKKITDSNTITFDQILEGGNRYQVDVIADYNRVDGTEHKGEVIGSSDHITINAKVELKTFELPKSDTYPTNKYFTLKFNFESNVKLDGDIRNVVVHTEEYDNSLENKDEYTMVGIETKDTQIDKVKCDPSIKDENGTYKTLCKADYIVPDKSGVIKLKPVSFTYLDKDKTVIDTELANAQEKLVDIIKWAPKITYTTINDWANKTVKIDINVDDKNNMLQKFDTGSYFKATLATKTSTTKIDSLNGEQTIIFDNLDDLKPNTPYRVMIKARYDQYHGNIVIDKSKEERIEEISVASYIHFITESNDSSLNDLELVTSDGKDIGTEKSFRIGDDVRLAFTINDECNIYPGFIPDKIKIEATNQEDDYKKEYSVTKKGNRYITTEALTDLSIGEHIIKIVEVSNSSSNKTIKVTHDNVINVNILETEASDIKLNSNTLTINTETSLVPNNTVAVTTSEEQSEKDEEDNDSNDLDNTDEKNIEVEDNGQQNTSNELEVSGEEQNDEIQINSEEEIQETNSDIDKNQDNIIEKD